MSFSIFEFDRLNTIWIVVFTDKKGRLQILNTEHPKYREFGFRAEKSGNVLLEASIMEEAGRFEDMLRPLHQRDSNKSLTTR